MGIPYKLVRVNDNITHNTKPRYLAIPKPRTNIDTEILKEEINVMSSFTPADVQGVIDNLAHLITKYLANGHTVTLDGIGTFGVTARMAKELDNTDYVPPGTIKVKSVSFRPAAGMKNKLRDVLFEKVVDKKKI
ncbi:MAG: HU family DNA-binding protein [Tannerellaceae bacterium]|nr:HU family DNA-binding protein [Tannerellaceae bacterium]